MKCKKAIHLIYLSREGEISLDEKRDLAEHLLSCKRCSEEHQASENVEERVSSLRGIMPASVDPGDLTHAIMRAIKHADAEQTSSIPMAWSFLVAPRFRIALSAALVLVVAVILFQTDRDARKIAALEHRLATSTRPAAPTTLLEIRRTEALLPPVASLDNLLELMGTMLPGAKRPWEPTSILDSSAHSPTGTQNPQTTLEQYLKKKYPRLATVRFDDGLDQRERQILATDGEPFLKDVEALIRKGDIDHER